jgi:hypothetical protein
MSRRFPRPNGGRDPDIWTARRSVGFALRLVVLLVPVAASAAASFGVTRLVPMPAHTGPRILWLTLVASGCGMVAFPARRLLRRLLPLAALLELSIRFPGTAPTRWKVAREAGSIRHLELLARGVPDTEPVRAATTILALVASLSRHDRVTRGHSERVRVFTDMIAQEMSLSRAERDRLRWAALIHDIGKLEVPGRLLRKPGKPTSQEWAALKVHPDVGARLAAPLNQWLGPCASVVVQHHERFDGTGYPAGLRGDDISIGARIVGLADAFEVMTAARPYKKAMSRTAALREVVKCSGTHFDPAVVRALLEVSTPRLRRALGPASWIGQLPVVATAPGAGIPSVVGGVARGAGTAVLTGITGAVVAGSLTAGSAAADTGVARHEVTGSVGTTANQQPPHLSDVQPRGSDGQPASIGTASDVPLAGSAASPDPMIAAGARASSAPSGQASDGSAATGGAITAPASTPSTLTGTVQQVAGAVAGTVQHVAGAVGGTVQQVTGAAGTVVGGLTATLGASTTSTAAPTPTAPAKLGGLLGKLFGSS